jgi:Uma2 family endonuclease
VRLDGENEPQPDALLRIDRPGVASLASVEDDYIEGAPELIVEIVASSASYDLHDKLRAYRRNGVREYLVWLTQEQAFRWYVLVEGEYVLQQPDDQGILRRSGVSWVATGGGGVIGGGYGAGVGGAAGRRRGEQEKRKEDGKKKGE